MLQLACATPEGGFSAPRAGKEARPGKAICRRFILEVKRT
jgi:hypothetical protein